MNAMNTSRGALASASLILGLVSTQVCFAAPPPWGTLGGHVRDAKTGQPIRGAVIRRGNVYATTRTDGLFHYAGIANPGTFQITADGYESKTVSVTIVKDMKVDRDFKLVPTTARANSPTTAVVEGTLTDKMSKRPLKDVVIAISNSRHRFYAVGEPDGNYMVKAIQGSFVIGPAHGEGFSYPYETVRLSNGQTRRKNMEFEESRQD